MRFIDFVEQERPTEVTGAGVPVMDYEHLGNLGAVASNAGSHKKCPNQLLQRVTHREKGAVHLISIPEEVSYLSKYHV